MFNHRNRRHRHDGGRGMFSPVTVGVFRRCYGAALVLLVLSLSASAGWAVDSGGSDESLKLVAGPSISLLDKKGAMICLLKAEDLEPASAHRLKLIFVPAVKEGSLKLRFFRTDGASSPDVLLHEGRRAMIDIDPGPTDLQVIVEEQGKLEGKLRIFASLYRCTGKVSSAGSGGGKTSAKSPPSLVERVDLDEALGGKAKVGRILRRLHLTRKQAVDLLESLGNAIAYLGRKKFDAVGFYLARAERIYPCSEVSFRKAMALGMFDVDGALKELDKAVELCENGRTVASLLGVSRARLKARMFILRANLLLKKVLAEPDLTDDEIGVLGEDFSKSLKQARSLDPDKSTPVVRVLRKKWDEMLKQRKTLAAMKEEAASGHGPGTGLKSFLEAHRLFGLKNYSAALGILDSRKDLPMGDSLYLKAEILLQLGRREGARKALEQSIRCFEKGDCLKGREGGVVPGTRGRVPPASFRAALSRVSLARYWAEKFKRSMASGADKDESRADIERAIELMDRALAAVPAQRSWQMIVNAYREERLKLLYPSYGKKSSSASSGL